MFFLSKLSKNHKYCPTILIKIKEISPFLFGKIVYDRKRKI